jgi:hypothetical protein
MRLQALISKPFPMLPVGIEPTTFGLKDAFCRLKACSYGSLGQVRDEAALGHICLTRDISRDTFSVRA